MKEMSRETVSEFELSLAFCGSGDEFECERVRSFSETGDLRKTVERILGSVRERGDEALREFALKFDSSVLDELEIPIERCEQAYRDLDQTVRQSLDLAASNIERFHRMTAPGNQRLEVSPGLIAGRTFAPLRRVGAYVPGGTAAYPSSVLMTAIPAKIAGVDEVLVITPPGEQGSPSALTLAACYRARVDRVFVSGGAGAIGALTYGTESIPAVDKIVGPGNAYVDEAKRQVRDRVGIDLDAGPSEVLIVADRSVSPEWVAAEMLAQAEHDERAGSWCLLLDGLDPREIREALDRQVRELPRAETIRRALAQAGALVTVKDRAEALLWIERLAPEHLAIWVKDAETMLREVRGAGSIFVGRSATVAFGDYVAGTNHVLPTGGRARWQSGLSTDSFGRFSTYCALDDQAASRLSAPTQTLALAEGLDAHARAAELRSKGSAPSNNADSNRALSPSPRSIFLDWKAYDPSRKAWDYDLSDNTNRFGVAPSAKKVLESISPDVISRYPSVDGGRLREALARSFQVPRDRIVVGCGSDDLLDSVMRSLVEPRSLVVASQPTFSMIETFARMNDLEFQGIEWNEALEPQWDRLAKSGASLIYLARPNNPCGQLWDRSWVMKLRERTNAWIVLDEAYGEFGGDSMLSAAVADERIILLRTFSKAWGLAGLRAGYAVASALACEMIQKASGPYKLNGWAEKIAALAVENDQEWLEKVTQITLEQRELWRQELEHAGFQPLASAANFLLVPLEPGIQAKDVAARLGEKGFGVRAFSNLPRLGDALRITVGEESWRSPFIKALQEVIG